MTALVIKMDVVAMPTPLSDFLSQPFDLLHLFFLPYWVKPCYEQIMSKNHKSVVIWTY